MVSYESGPKNGSAVAAKNASINSQWLPEMDNGDAGAGEEASCSFLRQALESFFDKKGLVVFE